MLNPCTKTQVSAVPTSSGSRLELLRIFAADIARRIGTASDTERMSLVLQLKNVQDRIAIVKHRLPLLADKPSRLAWVDIWTPA